MASGDQKSLLIVGPGVLGSYLGKLWLESNPGSTVVGVTNTTNNHARLQKIGITPALKTDVEGKQFPYVAFCAPPSGSADYFAEISNSLSHWNRAGSYVFTSSGGVCSVEDGSLVTDPDIPVAPLGSNPRTDVLLKAEQAVLQGGGNVVRLSGLYHAQRGAHTFFLKQGKVDRWGGYLVNLLHYEDAAGIAEAVLRGDGAPSGKWSGQTFLGTDGVPVTFEAMMAAVTACPAFNGAACTFTGAEGASKGKQYNNDFTRNRLHWAPKYSSFVEFMKAGGKDWYSTSGVF